MLRRPIINRFAVAGLVMLAAGLANGQEEDKPAANPAANERSEARFDIRFSGGRIDEFVRHLRESNPSANVLASEEAGRLILPSIEMKNITIGSALDAVELLTSQLPNPAITDTICDDSTQQETRIINTQNPVEPLEIVVRVMNASDALEPFRDDDAVDKLMHTIDVGLATVFEDSSPAISIKLHSETGLLFVRGREDKVDFVTQIIRELEKNNAPSAAMRQLLGGASGVLGGAEPDSKKGSDGK